MPIKAFAAVAAAAAIAGGALALPSPALASFSAVITQPKDIQNFTTRCEAVGGVVFLHSGDKWYCDTTITFE